MYLKRCTPGMFIGMRIHRVHRIESEPNQEDTDIKNRMDMFTGNLHVLQIIIKRITYATIIGFYPLSFANNWNLRVSMAPILLLRFLINFFLKPISCSFHSFLKSDPGLPVNKIRCLFDRKIFTRGSHFYKSLINRGRNSRYSVCKSH